MENQKNTFDPSKQYSWKPDAKVEFSASQFGAFVEIMQVISQTEIAKVFQGISMLDSVLRDVVRTNVELGNFKEGEVATEEVEEAVQVQ